MGRYSPTGALFDFFGEDPAQFSRDDLTEWRKGDVVVLNLRPEFSPVPEDALKVSLRREFPEGQTIGKFEVRWR